MRFIHTADLHLDAPTGALAERAAIRRGGLQALEQMIAYAIGKEIPYFIIAGDLFDRPDPSPATRSAVAGILEKAKQITFLIVAGNHDPLPRQGDWCGLQLPDNVHLFGAECEELCVGEDRFVGAGLKEGALAHPFAPRNEKTGLTVGIFHGAVGDSDPLHCLDAAALRESNFDYIALGHIHKPRGPEMLGATTFAYCGSPTAHGFDELGERSFLDVTLEPGGVKALRVVVDGYRFYEDVITLSPEDTQGDILGKMTALCSTHGEKDIYRFRVQGSTALPLPKSLEDYPALVEVIDETALPYAVETLAKEQSLRGFFVSAMLEKIATLDGEEKREAEDALRLGLEAFE